MFNSIKSPQDMIKPLICRPIDEEWKNNLKESDQFWFSGFVRKIEDIFLPNEIVNIKKILILRDKLLEFGGAEACMVF